METHTPSQSGPDNLDSPNKGNNPENSECLFEKGTEVIYGLHGKCVISSIENRKIAGENVIFYKLDVQRSSFSRSQRQKPAIWIPISTATERGLRKPMTPVDTTEVFSILASREYYFSLDTEWSLIQSELEACIRNEGFLGLAKVKSYLHVWKKKEVVLTGESLRLQELVDKMLLRELSEARGETIKNLEREIQKALRHKNLPDN